MIILPANTLATGGFEVANSCRFNDGDNPYMYKAGASGNRDTYTFSYWLKRGAITGADMRIGMFSGTDSTSGTTMIWGKFNSDDTFVVVDNTGSGNHLSITTNRKFRDVSSWYHFVVAVDTTQSTEADRCKIYVNGVQETSFSSATYPSQNTDTLMGIGSGYEFVVSGWKGNTNQMFEGYLAEVVHIDGLALAPTSFGEFDDDSPRIWKPIDVSGLTFGTNGFYLDFEDSSNLGNDANGGTDLTEANLAAADQATDTPTNNFATLNPLYKSPNSLNFSEGNCQIQGVSGNGGRFAGGTFAPASGKWYMEIKLTVSGSYPIMGVIDSSSSIRENAAYFVAADSGANQSGFAIFSNDDVYHNNDSTFDQWQTYATNDIIGLALDMDASTPTITFLKNNGSSEAFTTEAPNSGHYIFPAIGNYMQAAIAYCNFGGCPSYTISSAVADENGYGSFEYAPKSGYLAMCSKNIGENS